MNASAQALALPADGVFVRHDWYANVRRPITRSLYEIPGGKVHLSDRSIDGMSVTDDLSSRDYRGIPILTVAALPMQEAANESHVRVGRVPRTYMQTLVATARDAFDRATGHPERIEARAKAETAADAADLAALGVLRKLMAPGAEGKRGVRTWALALEQRMAAGTHATPLEHTALTFILRTGLFGGEKRLGPVPGLYPVDPALDREVHELVSARLRESWKHLTGKQQGESSLLDPLPWNVMRKADRRARVFNTAATISLDPSNRRAAQRADSHIGKFLTLEIADIAVLTSLLALAFTVTGGTAFLAGMMLQMGVISVIESFLHDKVGHARGKVKVYLDSLVAKGGILGNVAKTFLDTEFAHQHIHHNSTFRKDYTRQFDSEEQKAAVTKLILEQGEPGQRILREKYGLTLDKSGVSAFMGAVAGPTAFLITSAWLLLSNPIAFMLGQIGPTVAYPFTPSKLHPYLHKKRVEALAEAPAILRPILESRWMAMANRHHYLHHTAMPSNYNLSFPIADWLFGVGIQPNVRDLLEMEQQGLIYC